MKTFEHEHSDKAEGEEITINTASGNSWVWRNSAENWSPRITQGVRHYINARPSISGSVVEAASEYYDRMRHNSRMRYERMVDPPTHIYEWSEDNLPLIDQVLFVEEANGRV